MAVYKETLKLTGSGSDVTFHDITQQVRDIIARSGIKNGTVTVQTQHTTTSIIFEEFVHDIDFNGYDFLQSDLMRVLDRLIPPQTTEEIQYRYPGPAHLEFARNRRGPNTPVYLKGLLNADSHLRGSLFGASETFIIEDGTMLTGTFGYIFFVDWDRHSARERSCHVMVMGE